MATQRQSYMDYIQEYGTSRGFGATDPARARGDTLEGALAQEYTGWAPGRDAGSGIIAQDPEAIEEYYSRILSGPAEGTIDSIRDTVGAITTAQIDTAVGAFGASNADRDAALSELGVSQAQWADIIARAERGDADALAVRNDIQSQIQADREFNERSMDRLEANIAQGREDMPDFEAQAAQIRERTDSLIAALRGEGRDFLGALAGDRDTVLTELRQNRMNLMEGAVQGAHAQGRANRAQISAMVADGRLTPDQGAQLKMTQNIQTGLTSALASSEVMGKFAVEIANTAETFAGFATQAVNTINAAVGQLGATGLAEEGHIRTEGVEQWGAFARMTVEQRTMVDTARSQVAAMLVQSDINNEANYTHAVTSNATTILEATNTRDEATRQYLQNWPTAVLDFSSILGDRLAMDVGIFNMVAVATRERQSMELATASATSSLMSTIFQSAFDMFNPDAQFAEMAGSAFNIFQSYGTLGQINS